MRTETDPDAAWVERLAGVSRARADRGIREAAGDRRLFEHIARRHREAGRSSYIEIDAPLELYALARLVRPRHTVEVGVSSGVSTAYLLSALAANGRGTLHSVDLPRYDPKRSRRARRGSHSWAIPRGRAPGWAVPTRLRARWDLRIGDKRAMLPTLAGELPSVELFVYDVPHDDDESRTEFRRLDPIFSRGAVAIVDHGPNGGRCPALAEWARARRAAPLGRRGLGLWGFRAASLPPRETGLAPARASPPRPTGETGNSDRGHRRSTPGRSPPAG